MSISLGSTNFGSIYLGSTKIGEAYLGSVKVFGSTAPVDPFNPLGLPPYTIRLKFTDGETPSFSQGTAVQVTSSPNVWDLTYQNPDWRGLLERTNIIEVLGANTSLVTDMTYLFADCSSLTSIALFDTRAINDMNHMMDMCSSLTTVPLFDTHSVVAMDYMLQMCSSLTSIPLFDTSSVRSMNGSFDSCVNVASGALALYTQASSQAAPPQSYRYCFYHCGQNTTSGAAELAQIPSAWK